jgi:hypothetical protein
MVYFCFTSGSAGAIFMTVACSVLLFFLVRRISSIQLIAIDEEHICIYSFWTKGKLKEVSLSDVKQLIVKTRADGPMIPKYCKVIMGDEATFTFSITGIYKTDLYPVFSSAGIPIYDELGDGKLKKWIA